MKRLIVLIALVVFVASLSGCGALERRRLNGPCDAPVARTRIPRLSLPWRRNTNSCRTCGQAIAASGPVCNACSGPVIGTDPITTAPIVADPVYDSGVMSGPVYEGTVVERMPVPIAGPEMNFVRP